MVLENKYMISIKSGFSIFDQYFYTLNLFSPYNVVIPPRDLFDIFNRLRQHTSMSVRFSVERSIKTLNFWV